MIRAAINVQVFVCVQPTDMRKRFDGLSGMVRQILEQDPLSAALFRFCNRGRDRLKILYWDRDGLAIGYKRLERGGFPFPTDLKIATPWFVLRLVSGLRKPFGKEPPSRNFEPVFLDLFRTI